MTSTVADRLDALLAGASPDLLTGGLIGLEKECLRVNPQGGISQRPHPPALGAALTHPWITTDYSEALLELITPPSATASAALAFLADVQTFVYQGLQDELLWATSMPCVLHGEQRIPVACYGDSNAGRMKHVYRLGLGHRYGRVMQVIAGVHFNYSFSTAFWTAYQRSLDLGTRDERRFRDAAYMGLIRNLQRHGWLVPYLFGASPAVCKSFFSGKPTRLESFDETTYFEPYATSLRMGDIGYQNRREEGLGIKACYDSLQAYVRSLAAAIDTPAPAWEALGVRVDGEYRQLSANILQIENEYYSTVRPKQVLEGLEKPTRALHRRGIRYIELRSLDVNAYHPLGVDRPQIRFLEILMLHSVLAPSPAIGLQERWEIDRNFEKVAHRGRDPDLRLMRQGEGVFLSAWGEALLAAMQPLAEALDAADPEGGYSETLAAQRAKLADPSLTPSAQMLAEMAERGEGFYAFANRLAHAHQRYFASRELAPTRRQALQAEVERSHHAQQAIEREPQMPFEDFLAAYQAQGL